MAVGLLSDYEHLPSLCNAFIAESLLLPQTATVHQKLPISVRIWFQNCIAQKWLEISVYQDNLYRTYLALKVYFNALSFNEIR